ncbi:acid protease [Trichocladium antarcticum]|uniref:Acid protease n=1 Tax=Trichocladium antarcticum TaxID=1450529 RepID=A0AAN6UNV3_9PEZI|nr:acid protease [Trichocladium antarcticum]
MHSPTPHQRRSTKMRLGVGLLALAATATAQRVVPISIAKAPLPGPGPHGLGRRAAYSSTLINQKNAYFTEVKIGTPPQTATLHVDTGSSDLWVLWENSDLCNSVALQEEWGTCVDTFSAAGSSTYETVGADAFQIAYVDETGARGDYFSDVVSIGDMTLKGLQMGIAVNSTCNWGMLGIGYNASVAAAEIYPNIIDLMVDQGKIATKAYSMYLNEYTAETGTILFGGVDTEKFYGELKSVPTIANKKTGAHDHFTVALTSLTAVSPSAQNSTALSTSPTPLEVILDSGTSMTYLPPSVTRPLYRMLNAIDDTSGSGSGQILVDCAQRTNTDLHLAFQFNGPSGPVVNVSAAEFILDDLRPYIAQGSLALPRNLPWKKDNTCRVGVLPAEHEPPYLVGDTFLRSAYVVYDLDNHAIGLAQSALGAAGSKIVEIKKGQGVPKVSGVAPPPPRATPAKQNAGVGRVREGLGAEAVGVAAAAALLGMGLLGW